MNQELFEQCNVAYAELQDAVRCEEDNLLSRLEHMQQLLQKLYEATDCNE
jgi:hypothetical protein